MNIVRDNNSGEASTTIDTSSNSDNSTQTITNTNV
jgi:hypothetical protein